MATSRRSRSKPVNNSTRAGGERPESGAYTVETRTRRPAAPAPEPEPAGDSLASMFAALGAGGQVGIYRSSPQWARGHLQTLTLSPGETFDFSKLDELQRYWGGGTYQFRPMNRGRFAGSSRSIELDGPTLYRGQPHPKDPEREQRRQAAQVLPAPHGYQQQGYQQQGYQPQGGYQPPGYPPEPHGMQSASPELRMIGGFMDRMMGRLDAMEAKIAAPSYAPASAPDHVSGVLQTLELAQRIRDMFDPPGDDDDDDQGEGEAMNPQQMMMALAMKKLDSNPEAFFGGPSKPEPQPQPAAPAAGPRLIRPDIEPAPAGAGAPMDAAQILAALQQLSPKDRAALVNDVGNNLDPETLAEMAQLMQKQQAESAAG